MNRELERRVSAARTDPMWFDDYDQAPPVSLRETIGQGLFVLGFAAFIVWIAAAWVAGDPSAVAIGP